MKTIFLIALSSVAGVSAAAAADRVPEDVRKFIHNRDICDHFRDESAEGDSIEQKERRDFINKNLNIYCTGSDKHLAELKRKYKNDKTVISRLNHYEASVEGK